MLAFTLASRFRRAKQANRYISFVSMSSTMGIGLGCFVLIVLLSIMNGFENELEERLLSLIPHGELYSVDNTGIYQWQRYVSELQQDSRIKVVEPYTKVTGMLQTKGNLKAIELTGLDIAAAENAAWVNNVSQEDLARLSVMPNGVLLGARLMDKQKLKIGQRVQVLIPQVTQDLSFKAPKTMNLVVAGRIEMGGELDNYFAIAHLEHVSNSTGVESGALGLRFTLHDPFGAYSTMRDIGYSFPQAVYMSDWTRTQGHLYKDIQLVRIVVYIALSLVIAVACFNIVSTLVMAVKEKQAAIAILRTMGASDNLIRRVFMLQGLINGVIGITLGTSLALIVAPNLSQIVIWLEEGLGMTLLSGDIYFIDFLPSLLKPMDVVLTVVIAFILCIVATLYPAQQAVRTAPATALNR